MLIWVGEEGASPHVEVAEQRSGGAGGPWSRWPQGSGGAASPSKAGVPAGDPLSPPPPHPHPSTSGVTGCQSEEKPVSE